MNPSAREKVTASVVAVGFLLVAAWICFEALQVPFGSFRMPGAGFLPLLLGVILGLFSVLLLGMGLLSAADGSARVRPGRPEVLYLLVSIVAAAWLFERAGFLLTMTLFLAAAMRALATMSWVRLVTLALVGSVALYLVFGRVLLIALPSGILPF